VLDLMMPGMDGWDLRHAQKRDPRVAAIPVIAVSAAGKLPDADAQFRKPLDFEKLSVGGPEVRPTCARLTRHHARIKH
jgi:CheY-like chemotaxis protein